MSFWDTFSVKKPGPRYLAICDAIHDAIDTGKLGPGRKLPSHRMLAKKLGVSVGTVTRAYQEALDRGLVSGEIGRGSFVRYQTSPPLRVVRSQRFSWTHIDLYQNFPVAVPDIEEPAWAQTLTDIQRDSDLSLMSRASWSEVGRRQQLAGAKWIRRSGLEPSGDTIIDCPGVQTAINAIVGATTKPGDTVACTELCHPGFKAIAETYDLRVRGVAIDSDGLVPESLETLCREAAPRLLYCSPTIHPPTTHTMSVERRRDSVRIAERYEVLIIEDESAAFMLPDHS